MDHTDHTMHQALHLQEYPHPHQAKLVQTLNRLTSTTHTSLLQLLLHHQDHHQHQHLFRVQLHQIKEVKDHSLASITGNTQV
jgi:hypothetical protein